MRRRSSLSLALAVIGAVLALAPAAGAQATSIEGSFMGGTILPEAGTCAGVLCGTGTLEPFGEAGFVYAPESFEQISRSCSDVTATLHITLTETGDRWTSPPRRPPALPGTLRTPEGRR
jgi:hypothetical protein